MVPDTPGTGRIIVSVASAPGWGALVAQADDPVGEPRLVTLAAWALVESPDGARRLVGLVQKSLSGGDAVGEFALADEIEGFAGYSNRGVKTKRAD